MANPTIGNFAFSDRVHHVLIAAEFILLDEKRDRYFLLDELDSKQLLFSFSDGNINKTIEKYTSAGLIERRHLPQCINSFSAHQYGMGNHIWANVGSRRKKPYRKSQFIYALLLAIFVKVGVKIFGFGTAVNFMRELAVRQNIAEGANPAADAFQTLEEMASAIYYAGLKLPFKSQCLESSLALYFYACFSDIKSTFKIGVQRYDFLAHAWVEFEGCVVADDPALTTALPAILKIEPELTR